MLVVAVIGRIAGHFVPPAPPAPDAPPFHFDWHIVRASRTLVSNTLHIPRLFLAIIAISFFWAMGAVLAAQFPPLVKNALGADQTRRDPVPRHFLGRRRDRLGGGQSAARGARFRRAIRRPRPC